MNNDFKPEDLPIGTPVEYHRAIPFDPQPLLTQTISEPWQVGNGHWIVKVAYVPAGVSVKSLVKLN